VRGGWGLRSLIFPQKNIDLACKYNQAYTPLISSKKLSYSPYGEKEIPGMAT
jgi:hypothetical protein